MFFSNLYIILEIGGVLLVLAAVLYVLSWIRRNLNINTRDATLTVEELEHHAKKMALEHIVTPKKNALRWPIDRMNDNYNLIMQLYKTLNEDIAKKKSVPPAAEWLLDNYYVIEEQVKNIRLDLTEKNYNTMPVLKKGPYKGYTRIFAIAVELVSHVDAQIEEKTLIKYLEAYQSHTILFEREISIIPTMLRLAIIETIRTLCEKIRETQVQWSLADEIVDKWWSKEEFNLNKLKASIDSLKEVNTSFIEHLFYRLRRSERSFAEIVRYIDEKLEKFATTAEIIAQKEHNAQASNTVSLANCVVSLKHISNFIWIDLFESCSYVEKILRKDPSGTYPLMDVSSRNHYRNIISELAKKYGVSELHIAREAISLANESFYQNADSSNVNSEFYSEKKSHVGYYLMGKGLKNLEAKQKGRISTKGIISKWANQNPAITYLGSIIFLTTLIVVFIINFSIQNFYLASTSILSKSLILTIIITFIAVIIPSSELSTIVINWFVGKLKKPTIFPRLELKDGIPDALSTMVVIPALLSDVGRVKELIENMENHYLSNKENNLYFALIGAFKDSKKEKRSDDEAILKTASDGIKKLNQKHTNGEKDIFYFYNRIRTYNESDDIWTGWERKRGALMEFNALFLGSEDTSFSFFSSEILPDNNIKYVITLDADTVLPIGMAKKMIATMAHPINTPVIDEARGIVIDGHGLMQPRISFDMDSSNRSTFSRIFTGQEGIDAYSSAISDVYQDLFGEGIFTGKGIYDLKVFQKILKDSVPGNSVLSHDLLEGSYVRAALVSDLELVDSYPSKFNSYMARLHRWIRGDWQLLPWLSKKIYNREKKLIKNPLTYVSIWKMVDNLRRSLIAPCTLLLIFLGLGFLPGAGEYWLSLALSVYLLPLFLHFVGSIISGGLKIDRIKRHIPGFFGLKALFFQFVLTFMFLPYQALMVLNAITITLARVFVTKKNLLSWVTSDDNDKRQSSSLISYLSTMYGSILCALLIATASFLFKPDSLVISLGMLLLWAAAPFVAFYISKDIKDEPEILEASEIDDLKRIARRTWRYFEEFSNYKNTYLPPDNFQEDPPRGIAYRTSPTNIGLGLLASLTARDMGYIGTHETIELIAKTISSVEKMEKWNGHLYNWYDTKTLMPLKPEYVSTVDSGNLVCYLITLAKGLEEYLERYMVEKVFVEGIKDTLSNGTQFNFDINNVLNSFEHITQAQDNASINLNDWQKSLDNFPDLITDIKFNVLVWKTKTERMVSQFKKELLEFTPWVHILRTIPSELLDNEYKDETTNLISIMNKNIKLKDLPEFGKELLVNVKILLEKITSDQNYSLSSEWLRSIIEAVEKSNSFVIKFIENYNELIFRVSELAANMSFECLYDEQRHLFSIGYNIERNYLSNSYYDLLASEARQTSYIAIARGEVPVKHWFMLGRSLTVVDNYKGLVSWSGTMFEYLMPTLIMRSYRNTLLDETYSFVIKSQKKYGKQRGMPWGSSESAFNSLDINLDYQYKAIGIPWLGLKRGLIEDAVAAPYSTFLALQLSPEDAYKNIKHLRKEGLEGSYGFYEAADFTPERLSLVNERVVIKSYMAHHEGMSLVAINNYINKNIMQIRFSSDSQVKAARLLLQEKVPNNVVFTKENKEKIIPYKGTVYRDSGAYRRFTSPNQVLPQSHILSNGIYSLFLTDKGTGYSRSRKIEISRWRNSSTNNNSGMFFYLKNLENNNIWSATYSPINKTPEKYEVIFTSDKATYKRIDGEIETLLEIVVASGDNAEIRRIKIKNNSEVPTSIELTSYFEVVLATENADISHPAFSNLFIRTEYNKDYKALIANRRPRGNNECELWLACIPVTTGDVISEVEYETDRMQFIGRDRTPNNPISMDSSKPLTNSSGSVLDPIFSHRIKLQLGAGQSSKISFVTFMSYSRDGIMELLEKYSNPENCDAAFWLALTRSQVETKYLNIKAAEMELYQSMISSIIYLNPIRKKYSDFISNNQKGQADLWAYGISGDKPIILVKLDKIDNIEILYELLKAHEYWRLKHLSVDLVILITEENSYTNPLYAVASDIVNSYKTHDVLNTLLDVFILNINNMNLPDVTLLSAIAKLIFVSGEGTMKEQMSPSEDTPLPPFIKTLSSDDPDYLKYDFKSQSTYNSSIQNLLYYNGLGGFEKSGSEYHILLENDINTPAPWINVIANPKFGFFVSESGGGYTWSKNSRENKLTPWSNDPVSDNQGEIIYLQNENSEIWSITPQPIRGKEDYLIKHGFGYSEFLHDSHGINQSLVQFVPLEGSAKISIVTLENDSDIERNLTLTYYIEPILGVSSQDTSLHIYTSTTDDGKLIISNNYNKDFAESKCFIDASVRERSVTGDRNEFFGSGNIIKPEALMRTGLSGNVGAGYNPCAAMQLKLNIKQNSKLEVVLILGVGRDNTDNDSSVSDITLLSNRFNDSESAKAELEKVKLFWQEKLTTIQVETPDPSMNILLNGWLLYQVLSCRMWARSAFYQSGGAFGFRDQLQDCLSLSIIWPEIAREQIIKHAAHQFIEGDVLHWWHEPGNKGTRTRISDDYLWLVYVTAEYIRITGDSGILDSEIPFVDANLLDVYEEERYCAAQKSERSATLYDHCILSLENAMKFGEHGLPLIGSGDWNDGMNTVGNLGKGESVWLGWFLADTIKKFIPLCEKREDIIHAKKYSMACDNVIKSIEENAWDGNWYKRAYFDNGSALGSVNNSECKIDSLAQTWATISGLGDASRVSLAMSSMEDYLVSREDGLIKLLTPPFDSGELEPGYIKSYVPGIRENGGQYTHAAAWAIEAFSHLKNGDKAVELFGLINPINHSRTNLESAIYKVEPYVIAADVYSSYPHNGRGGWTWYTGSASWIYRVGIENILGFQRNGEKICFKPCVPFKWESYKIKYTYLQTEYNITFKNPNALGSGKLKVSENGKSLARNEIDLVNDKGLHEVEVVIISKG